MSSVIRNSIIEAADRCGKSRKEIACLLGVSESELSKMFSGVLRLDIDTFAKILQVVGIEPLKQLAASFGQRLVPEPRSKELLLQQIELVAEKLEKSMALLREAINHENEDGK